MKKQVLFRVLAVSVSLAIALCGLELAARVYFSEYRFRNFWSADRDLMRSAYPVQFDRALGWTPKPGSSGADNIWGTQVTILEHGVRANANNKLPTGIKEKDLILAVGDSFTFGDQVSDSETYPSILEEMLGTPVLNAGVFGYGVDQSYLRMKILAEIYEPTIIVFGLIPNDIERCELSERTAASKPYFEASNNSLILHDEHVIQRPPVEINNSIRQLLGYSFFVHAGMNHFLPTYWILDSWRNIEAHKEGEKVTCLIFKELAGYLEQYPHIRNLYLLVQYNDSTSAERRDKITRVLNCVNHPRIQVIDLWDVFADYKKNDNQQYQQFFHGHMTKKGNHLVASILAEAVRKNGS